ncbi:M23 family metallopeptidase [Streptomyces sp. NPDC001480]|uniref:M23 family metallopeptidase n=1 Tax=Streptomyces sp. NPDC001480 TaxID=3364577 RepID=UPI0036BAE51C
MIQRVPFRFARTSPMRTRVAALAVGVGASAVLGVGVANAVGPHAAAATTTVAAKPAAAKPAKPAVKPAAKHAANSAATWVDPVKKYTLSAGFDQAGSHWIHKHSGQDFAVPIGTNVVAAHGGTVVKAGGYGAGDGPAYGNAIVIKHADGQYSQYAHLSRIDVRPGQVVSTGQHIAESGNTGNSTGPHLHFEIRKTPNYGSAIDPVPFLRAMGVTV